MKILLVFGTRPEAIKMAPIIKLLEKNTHIFNFKVCVTAQHRQMLDQVLNFFDIIPDYDLNLMKKQQNLSNLTSDVLIFLKPILEDYKPDYVFVHGDTTTSMASALASFYSSIKVCHIEAGLRTYNKYSPYPEEMNRQITSKLADLHFAPTETAKKNLLNEGISEDKIFVVGNTVIDALLIAKDKVESINDGQITLLSKILNSQKKIILVTGHRRENIGDGFINICNALKILSKYENIQIIFPVHLNPNVKGPVYDILADIPTIHLIEPLDYPAFVWLMKRSDIILTDSGGIQEEAPSLGKPVLVMRNNTERPEAIECGTAKLVGTNTDTIVNECINILNDDKLLLKNLTNMNPYGMGNTSQLILNHI